MEWSALLMLAPPLIMLIGISVWLGSARKERLRLDSNWSWLGPGIDHGSGRAWRGRLGHRPVEVIWLDRNTAVSINSRPHTRATFRRAGTPFAPLVPEEAEVALPGGIIGSGPDLAAIRTLQSQPGAREALHELLWSDQPGIRSVAIGPARSVSLRARDLRDKSITPDQTRRWVEALLVLARSAEHRSIRTPERAAPREREACPSPSLG